MRGFRYDILLLIPVYIRKKIRSSALYINIFKMYLLSNEDFKRNLRLI